MRFIIPAILSPLIYGATLVAAPVSTPLISNTLLNGSFENGTGTPSITSWQTGFGTSQVQRLNNNASNGGWSLVIGQNAGGNNVGASVNTNYTVVRGDTFNLTFKWLPKLNWTVDDQVKWRLFTTSDNTPTGYEVEISSGTVSGFANTAPYQTVTLTGITGVTKDNEDRNLWLQFRRGSSGTGKFARIDEVSLTAVSDPQTSYQPVAASELVAYYPMDGDSLDYSSSTSNHDGTWTGTETYLTGQIGTQSADLSAANATITLPHTLTTTFTLSFWIKTTSAGGSGTQWWQGLGILDANSTGVGNDLGISLLGSKLAFGVGDPDTTILSQTSINDGNWHHISAQRDHASGEMRLFINGILEAQTSGPTGIRDDSVALTLGSLSTGSGFINACIDDLRIFSNTLDSASIAKLHSSAGDYDGDNVSDLTELISVSSWLNPNESPTVPAIAHSTTPNEVNVSYNARAGRSYLLQRSGSLQSTDWDDVGTSMTPKYHGTLNLVDDNPDPEKSFYRLLITGRGLATEKKPNIVIIYGDDVGYGDVGAYNTSSKIPTPNIDTLASQGIRFTNGHCTASTCSPSRYSMLTGVFAFRDNITILPPTAPLSIPETTYTLPEMLKEAGYKTAVIGKWHLGIGIGENTDWNVDIKPGPLEIGFDSSYIIPTTNDRVPCVYLDNYRVDGLDPTDPLYVHNNSYAAVNIAGSTQYPHDDASAQTYVTSSSGHNDSIIGGIGRIGYMSGAQTALWDDETMAQVFVAQAENYIAAQDGQQPFFLYFASQDIHTPRAPHPDFQGSTILGPRGDAMVQFDWSTGKIMQALEDAGLTEDTIVIFSSDNGPVYVDAYDDGSADDAAQGHDASGPYRGGKYGILEAGTRVPFIIRWPAKIQPGVSGALVSQVDFMASLAELLDIDLPQGTARDSRNTLDAFLGNDPTGLPFTVQQNSNGSVLALRAGDLKYTNQSTGRLFNLTTDIQEFTNISSSNPTTTSNMAQQLEDVVKGNGVRE